jgi:hypothetical protein
MVGLAGNKRQVQANMRSHLIIVPRGTSCHRTVELAFSPTGFDFALSCDCSLLLSPPELSAVNPDAVHHLVSAF